MRRTTLAGMTAALLLIAGAINGCATDHEPGTASPEAIQQGIAGFYAEAQQVQQELAAIEDGAARFARLAQYKDRLRQRAAAYEQSVVDGRIDPLEQQVYDELQGLLLTLNNIPDRPFSPDYCEIVRQSIYLAWAPGEPAPAPEQFSRSVREGLRFLDVLCAP